MTHSKLSPYDFIQYAFCPHVAVLSSPLAEQICQKGNLSFIEMVQPFCRLTSEVHFRDPSGSLVNVKNLRVIMLDVNSRPPQTTLARKFLNESVSSANVDQVTTLECGDARIEIPATVPWFESWRETFLQVQFPADHEFTKHYLACVIVLSTAEAVPLETARSLALQLQHLQAVTPGRLPKWFTAPSPATPAGQTGSGSGLTPAPPTLLTCYLLLHDASEGDSAKAEAAMAAIREEFGSSSCFLLTVNSRPPGQREDAGHLPDPWSQFLNKRIEPQDGADSDYSSPRTPADVGTNLSALGPSVGGDSNLEVGQEASESGVISSAVPVVSHPLSPQSETPSSGPPSDESHPAAIAHNHLESSTAAPHINSNVWAGSASSGAPHLPHGTSLTAADLDRIRTFVTEFCSRALLPHVEKQIQYLNDQISNKKGVSRSLLSATKRWFGPNKPGSPRSTSPNNVIYSGDAPELQLRRLADLCFMFRHYSLAYQAFHSAKRDFAADGAWLHFAGALEMAALSSFMTGEYNRKTQDYHEEAIITYLNTCRMPQFATRSTLLSVVCLKSRNLHSDAARQLIRMTSEDSDLRSALLLEEAAYCFLQASRPGLLRKYAFHMVLAGHRFSKAGQRKHSLRCYQQAYQVYKGKGWSLAEDHIHFTIGRQAGSLGQRALATKALARLLAPGSKQVPTQQAYHLREFLVMQQQLSAETGAAQLPLLPLPIVNSSVLQVLTGSPPHDPGLPTECVEASGILFEEETKEFSSVWLSLEEQLLTESLGNPPVVFKPMLTLFNRLTDNSRQPLMVLGEPLWVCITVQNPLGVQLLIQDVRLLWTFQPENTEDVVDSELAETSECQRWVDTQILAHLVLQPSSSEKVILNVIPQGVGLLNVKGLAYRLTNPSPLAETANAPQAGANSVYVDGKQVFSLEPIKGKDKGTADKILEDLRLQPKVLPSAPLLQASFSSLPAELICGEIQRVTMTLVNYGCQPLKNLLLGSDTPHFFSLDRAHPTGTVHKSRQNVVRLPLESGVLEAGAHIQLNLWIRSPDDCGSTKLRLLFYYESAVDGSPLKYRLLRHCWNLAVLDSLHLSATPQRSAALSQEGGINITARVTNTNKVQDLAVVKLSLLQVSMSSSLWELSNLPVVPSEADVTLGPQECAHLMFRARSVSSKSPVLSDLALCPKVKDLVPLSNSPHYDFLLRHCWTATPVKAPLGPVVTENSESPVPIAASAEAALRVDATFVVRWEAEVTDAANSVRRAFGQHHVTLSRLSETASCPVGQRIGRPRSLESAPTALRVFGPDRNVPSESDLSAEQVPSLEALQRLLTYYLQHPPRLAHNFYVQRLCFVPVQLFLRNCCESPLRVEVNLSGGQSSLTSQSQLYVPHASSVVRWVGQLVSHFELPPHGTHNLSLRSAVTAPGTYDLGALLTVSCRFANEPSSKDTVQGARIHSAVVVSHTDGQLGEQQVQQLANGVAKMAVKDVTIPA